MDVQHANQQLKTMHAIICRRTFALTMAFINRKMRQMSRGVYLQQQGFDEIRRLLQAGERIVLMPVYRSFADLPVILYSLFTNKIEIPFTMGTNEDSPSAIFIEKFLKRVGYIPATR